MRSGLGKWFDVIGVACIGFLIGFFFHVWIAAHEKPVHKPYCPTEDSCSVDYHDGQWWITEVTP